MRCRLFLILLSLFSCKGKDKISLVKFNFLAVEKRIGYENRALNYFNNFSAKNLQELNHSLSVDSSFILLYAIAPGKVYYSSNDFKFWNYVNYQNYKQSMLKGAVKAKCSLGTLSKENTIVNGVTVKTNTLYSSNVDSVLCLEYEINEANKVYIFFDTKKIKKLNRIMTDEKITAQSSTYTDGRNILLDSISYP